MDELRNRLQDADPLAREPGLSTADAERIRRQVLGARRHAMPVQRGVFMAAAVGILVVVGAAAILVRTALPIDLAKSTPASVEPSFGQRPGARQLQFYTAGGTRVIWTFNPEFEAR